MEYDFFCDARLGGLPTVWRKYLSTILDGTGDSPPALGCLFCVR